MTASDLQADSTEHPRATPSQLEVVLPPALVMLEEVIALFVKYGLGIEHALDLVRDAYIRVTMHENPGASVRALTRAQDGEEQARLPMSRNTINAVRERTQEIYAKSLQIQFERYIRMNAYPSLKLDVPIDQATRDTSEAKAPEQDDSGGLGAYLEAIENRARDQISREHAQTNLDGDERERLVLERIDALERQAFKTRDELFDHVRQASEFRYVQDQDFETHFDEAFDRCCEDCLEEHEGRVETFWVNTRRVTYNTTEALDRQAETVERELALEREREAPDEARIASLEFDRRALLADEVRLSVEIAQRIAQMLREQLEHRFLSPRMKHTPRLPNAGFQACAFEILPSELALLDRFYFDTILPFITRLATTPDTVREELERVGVSGRELTCPRYKIVWMWGPQTPQQGEL